MKHGPIALVDRETPCVFVAPRGSLHAKTLSNVEEVRARHGLIIAVGTEGDDALAALSDVFLPIPDAPEVVQPLLAVVPLQLLAYHVALRPRLRHRQAAQPGQERDRRVTPAGGAEGRRSAACSRPSPQPSRPQHSPRKPGVKSHVCRSFCANEKAILLTIQDNWSQNPA